MSDKIDVRASNAVRLPDPETQAIGTTYHVDPMVDTKVIVPMAGGVVKTVVDVNRDNALSFRVEAQSIGDGEIRHYWSWGR